MRISLDTKYQGMKVNSFTGGTHIHVYVYSLNLAAVKVCIKIYTLLDTHSVGEVVKLTSTLRLGTNPTIYTVSMYY